LGNIFAGISGFGAGVRGGDVGAAYKQVKDLSESGKRNALEQFDRQIEEDRRGRADESEARAEGRLMKKEEREDAAYKLAREATLRERDPNSVESMHAKEYFKRLVPNIDPTMLEKMTAAQIKSLSPNYEKMADREYKTKEFQQKVKQHEEDQTQRKELHEAGQAGADRRNAWSNASRERAAALVAGQKIIESQKLPPAILEKVAEQRDQLNQAMRFPLY